MDDIWCDDYFHARSWGWPVWEAEAYADSMYRYDTGWWY